MRFRNLYLLASALLSGCLYDTSTTYPLAIVGKENYEEVSFRYEKIKTFEYEFCDRMYSYVYYDLNTEKVNHALEKFREEYSLKKDEYVIVNEVNGSFFMIPFIYTEGCKIIELDLIRKVGN